MAPLLEDPRIRQTWNHISHNAETATESAAAGIWTFTHTYINPCFASIGASFEQCTGKCFPDREERARRLRERGRTRGRAEYSFDFYDDWDEDEGGGSGGILGWGNDELDRLLAGSGAHGPTSEQPSGRRRGMSYGTGKGGSRRNRKNTVDGLPDPTIIPSTNTLGFLQRLPWKFGGTLRYKPSAADLQDHPGSHRAELEAEGEGEPLIDEDERSEGSEDGDTRLGHTRKRSSTTGSGDTSDSFRSRGDLFPSDGEDDAVPLSDEFAMVLERRSTGLSNDDLSSAKTRNSKGKTRAGSRAMSRTFSRTTQSSGHSRPPLGAGRGSSADLSSPSDMIETPSMTDLQQEEERLREEEDAELESKRQAAIELARKRGLSISQDGAAEVKEYAPDIQHKPMSSSVHIDADEEYNDEEQVAVIAPAEIFESAAQESPATLPKEVLEEGFVPARLPNF